MRRLAVTLLLVAIVAGCSTRELVVKPEEVPPLNDQRWVIKTEPRPR